MSESPEPEGDNGWSMIPKRITARPVKELSDNAFRVYVAIDGFAGKQGVCTRGKTEIAKAAGGKDERTVTRAIVELLKLGLLREEKTPKRQVGRVLHVLFRYEHNSARGVTDLSGHAQADGVTDLSGGDDRSVPEGRQICQGGVTDLSPRQEPQGIQEPNSKNPAPSQSPASPAETETASADGRLPKALEPQRSETRQRAHHKPVSVEEDPDPPPAKWTTKHGTYEHARYTRTVHYLECLGERDGVWILTGADIEATAGMLSRCLGDVANLPYYRDICCKVADGEISPTAVHEAIICLEFRKGALKNPAAYFVDVLATKIGEFPAEARPEPIPAPPPAAPVASRPPGVPARAPKASMRVPASAWPAPAPTPSSTEIEAMMARLRSMEVDPDNGQELAAFGRRAVAEGYRPSAILEEAAICGPGRMGRSRSRPMISQKLSRRKVCGEAVRCEPAPLPEHVPIAEIESLSHRITSGVPDGNQGVGEFLRFCYRHVDEGHSPAAIREAADLAIARGGSLHAVKTMVTRRLKSHPPRSTVDAS